MFQFVGDIDTQGRGPAGPHPSDAGARTPRAGCLPCDRWNATVSTVATRPVTALAEQHPSQMLRLSGPAAEFPKLLPHPRVDQPRIGCPLRPDEEAEDELSLLARGTDEQLTIVPPHTAATSGRSWSGTNTSPASSCLTTRFPAQRTRTAGEPRVCVAGPATFNSGGGERT